MAGGKFCSLFCLSSITELDHDLDQHPCHLLLSIFIHFQNFVNLKINKSFKTNLKHFYELRLRWKGQLDIKISPLFRYFEILTAAEAPTHQVVSLWCWTQWGGQWHIIHATWEHFQILDMRPVLTNTRVSGHASCSHQHTCSGSRNIVELLYVMSLHLLEHSILLLIIATVPFFMKKNAQEHFFKKICFFSNY